ncbi:hypothetical protein SDC9_135678 [bioreactor metagenome]|uniref:Uncharacterized protein n=1 Tax=bioreactor metagenome TaxID=1076179 RepID=A0A645DGH8_9ZZZZ
MASVAALDGAGAQARVRVGHVVAQPDAVAVLGIDPVGIGVRRSVLFRAHGAVRLVQRCARIVGRGADVVVEQEGRA